MIITVLIYKVWNLGTRRLRNMTKVTPVKTWRQNSEISELEFKVVWHAFLTRHVSPYQRPLETLSLSFSELPGPKLKTLSIFWCPEMSAFFSCPRPIPWPWLQQGLVSAADWCPSLTILPIYLPRMNLFLADSCSPWAGWAPSQGSLASAPKPQSTNNDQNTREKCRCLGVPSPITLISFWI